MDRGPQRSPTRARWTRPSVSLSIGTYVVRLDADDGASSASDQINVEVLLSEIVALPRWSSGNALVILIDGSGERVAESFNGFAGAATLLHVEYVP